MKQKLSRINFTAVRKDIERFIEDKTELKMFDQKIMIRLIDNAREI